METIEGILNFRKMEEKPKMVFGESKAGGRNPTGAEILDRGNSPVSEQPTTGKLTTPVMSPAATNIGG